MKEQIVFFVSIALLCGCRQQGGQKTSTYRDFPIVEVPALVSEPSERAAYMADHFWDGFFDGNGPTDTNAVLGVRNPQLETQMATFITILDQLPLTKAKGEVGSLFTAISEKHSADTSSHVFPLMTELVSKYLYDPNSPLRNEDYYLPFAEALSTSEFTPEDSKAGFAFEVRVCSSNQVGSKVKDFKFKDKSGRVRNLYGAKADYTLLFFSNPGCSACRQIITDLTSLQYLDPLINAGKLAVVNIYIDFEEVKWEEAVSKEYPSDWINGYDWQHVIRDNELFVVRAIPSLYLLDSDKRVILKDAPTERVIARLNAMANNQ